MNIIAAAIIKGVKLMGLFGIPWSILIMYFAGIIAVPIVIEILLHSNWWKKQCDFYYSFNDKK